MDSDYTICTEGLVRLINIGFKNYKNLTIEGDVYYGVGESMVGGLVLLRGNCVDLVGSDID